MSAAEGRPDLAKLLWPRTVAVVGASPDTESLRGRIMKVMSGHPFAGALYPISRSHAEVMGLKAYPSVADLPVPPDLAVLIIPAQHVPTELERCGKAGVRSAVVLSSGFAEAPGGDGAGLQDEMRAVVKRYGMAVMGPNSEGFANTAAALCPTFSPAVEPSERPLLPSGRERGQLAVIAQSGGIGFSFFDHGRAKELAFRYVVTTGNEACLETLDFADFILDEGKVSALLMLLEDVKSPDTFRRVAEKALKAGSADHRQQDRAVGSRRAGCGFAHGGAGGLLRRAPRDVPALRPHRGPRSRRNGGYRRGLRCLRFAIAGRKACRHLHGVGRRGWLDGGCVCSRGARGSRRSMLRRERRSTCILPTYGTSQNPVDATAQALHKIGYAGLAEFVVASPAVDSVIVVMTARNAANLERQREALTRLAAQTAKPILLWSYTLPAPASVKILSEAGYPLFTDIPNCARTLRAMADYRALRERFLRPIEVRAPLQVDRAAAQKAMAASGPVLCEWEARPVLAAYGIGANAMGVLAGSSAAALAAAHEIRGAVALKVQSPDIPHKTEAGAVTLSLTSRDEVRLAFDRVLDNARRHAPQARILGVLVQPMAPPGREVILGVKRDATFGSMLMVGLGGVQVEVFKDVALAPLPLNEGDAREMLARLEGAPLLGAFRGQPATDVDALVDVMVRLAQFASDHADTIAEIDLNPVLVHAQGKGVSVVDALIVKR